MNLRNFNFTAEDAEEIKYHITPTLICNATWVNVVFNQESLFFLCDPLRTLRTLR